MRLPATVLALATCFLYPVVHAVTAASPTAVAAGGLIAAKHEPTAPWVTVDRDGQPVKTYHPSVTTVSGVASGRSPPLRASTTTTEAGYSSTRSASPRSVARSRRCTSGFAAIS